MTRKTDPKPSESRFVRRLRTPRPASRRDIPERWPVVRGPTLW
ncbi:hypothetical protein [Actinoplanes sp. NBRC 103695]|nr:hypothetical protein [Actinoplanes sp. NBRC 103695]